MMGHKFSAAAAVLAAVAFMGCSAGDHGSPSGVAGGKDGSMSFNLLAGTNVQISAINYDLNTQAGVDVVDGSIPVPSDQSQHVPVLGIQSLSSGDYALKLSATGTLPDGSTIPCTSPVEGFHVTSGSNTFVGDIALTCTVTTQTDTSGSATADVSVSVVNNSVGSVIETFTYGPRSVDGTNTGSACVFPPIALKIQNANTAITYAWAATPDGTFTLNSTNTSGTYNCASDGDKTLTLTGMEAGQTSTKEITVHCNATPCGFACGNGILEPGEQCDDGLPHCNAQCKIVPVCGDGIIDSPETCEPPNTATCSATCTAPTPTCGDGVVNQPSEQCDNGMNNSNTAPNACRTDCLNPSCGDGVVDTGEQCDPPNGTTCDTTCKSIAALPDVACLNCLHTDATESPAQVQYCDGDPKCLAVEKCEVDKKCFDPVPANCYCGTNDLTACADPSFVPTGPCVDEIKAGETATNNSDAQTQLFDFTVPAGVATSILNDAFANAPECHSSCF